MPKLDLASGNIDIGNNTAMNIGNDNTAAVGSVAPGLPGGFSNGVYNIGNRNMGLAGGVLSNLIQIGDDNYTPASSLATKSVNRSRQQVRRPTPPLDWVRRTW